MGDGAEQGSWGQDQRVPSTSTMAANTGWVQVLKVETKQAKPHLALWVKGWLIWGDLVLVHIITCRSESIHGRGKDP